MLLMIDNYDSFTYNLVQYFGELGEDVRTVRNDEVTLEEIVAMQPARICISPGPCTPHEAGVSVPVLQELAGKLPILGVCLGHQSLVEAFGGRTIRGVPIHGKDAEIEHDGRGIYQGLPRPFKAGRYHSLIADPDLPDELEQTAGFDDVVMGIRHRSLPADGVQFHPESVLTPGGKRLLRNFLE